MPSISTPKNPIALSYFGLRNVVGWIGVLFPFVLAIGQIFITNSFALQLCVSDYYYTGMRNIFEGCLCIIGVFLAATWGYDQADEIAGRIAGLAAIGVAWFPTTPPAQPTNLIGIAHGIFASALFLTLAIFCICLFPKSDRPPQHQTAKKRQRNTVYYVCGWTIVVCIALSVITRWTFTANPLLWPAGLFWFESGAIIAFGIAWLIKGETFLKDEGVQPHSHSNWQAAAAIHSGQ